MSEQDAVDAGGAADAATDDTGTATDTGQPDAGVAAGDANANTKTPETSEAEAATGDEQEAQQKPSDTDAGESSDFKLPDEHKDKPWAAKVKSQDDIFKQLDNLTELAGKKVLPPLSADASAEDVAKYYETVRPESPDAYNFGDRDDSQFAIKQEAIGKLLHETGQMPQQAEALIAGYNALEEAALNEATSEDGYKEEMVKTFGDDYDADVVATTKHFEEHLGEDDQKIFDKMPNKFLGAMYRYTKAIREAYGVEEGGDENHAGKGGDTEATSIEEKRSAIRSKIVEIEGRMHTASEKQKLVDELQDTYK